MPKLVPSQTQKTFSRSTTTSRRRIRGSWSSRRGGLLSSEFQRVLLLTVQLHNRQVRRGGPALDLSRVFMATGKALERSNGNEKAAISSALGVATSTTTRPGAMATHSRRLQRALAFTIKLHKNQARKGTSVPYVSHLLGVAGRILAAGGSENEVIAGLLHDAVEDQGGQRTLNRIRRRFGPEVASIVREVTERSDASWHQRKQTKITRIARGGFSRSALLVKLADNLHNTSTMLAGSRAEGRTFWNIFTGGRDGTLWYYRSLVGAYRTSGLDTPMLNLLDRRVRTLEREAR